MTEMVETAAILTQATPALPGDPGRDRAGHRHLRRPGHRLGLRRGPARDQPLPRPVRHPLSRAGHAGDARWPTSPNLSLRAKEWNGDLVFLHEAARRPRRPLLRRAGGQAGRGAARRSWLRAREVLERLESEAESPAKLDDLPLFAAFAPVSAPVLAAPSRTDAALVDAGRWTA